MCQFACVWHSCWFARVVSGRAHFLCHQCVARMILSCLVTGQTCMVSVPCGEVVQEAAADHGKATNEARKTAKTAISIFSRNGKSLWGGREPLVLVHLAWSRHLLSLRARGASAAAWKVLRTAEAVKVVDEVNMQLAIGAHSSSSTLLELAPAAPSVPETVGLSVNVNISPVS